MKELELKKIEGMKKIIDENVYTHFKDYYKKHGRFYHDDIVVFFEKCNIEVTKEDFEETFIARMELVSYTTKIIKNIEKETKKKMFDY